MFDCLADNLQTGKYGIRTNQTMGEIFRTFTNCQSQPGTAKPAGGRGINLGECLEQSSGLIFCHSDP